jgi:diguanylate cyclase (GGDEF)-like protein
MVVSSNPIDKPASSNPTNSEYQPNQPAKIMIVDDNAPNLMVLGGLLDQAGYRVFPLRGGQAALAWLEQATPDLMLLDIRMPDLDGYEVCRRIKANPSLSDIPVIFISAADAIEDKIRGFDVGGIDYITKPFEEREVLARVQTHLQLYSLQRQLGEKIKHLEAANARIHELSIRDELTKLYNRRYFNAAIAQAWATSERNQQPLCVAMADVDFFKRVNDQFSHAVGDVVLATVAQILYNTSRSEDILARYGGEEFILALPTTALAAAHGLCERLRGAVEDYPWASIHPQLRISISIGLAEYQPGQASSLTHSEVLIAAADAKLYQAKHDGRNCVRL